MKNKDGESRNTSGRNNFGYAVMHVRERLLCFAGYHPDDCECEHGMMFERLSVLLTTKASRHIRVSIIASCSVGSAA